MAEHAVVEVAELIDERGLGARQIVLIVLCSLVALLDGMDLQSIGLAAPAMAGALRIAPNQFGLVFSMALAGLALGAFALGPAADRYGRRTVLIGATLCFGIFTIGTAFANDLNELLVYRFLTGFGLGGAMPSFISLASEYAPRRMRATIVSLLWAGFPLGGVVGGVLASRLIPSFGWRSVFYVGGAPAILLAVALALALPESLGYLINSGAPPERVARAFRRVFPDVSVPGDARFALAETTRGDARVAQLFVSGRAAGTLLLWTSFFFIFMILVTNSAWTPLLLSGEGLTIERSAVALALFNFGSLFGSGAAGWLLARLGVLAVLPISFVVSGLAYGLVGHGAPSFEAVAALEAVFGLFAGCASSALIALAAISYPTAIRAAGVGWATAAGRCGSIAGPLVVRALAGAHWPIADIFVALGASVLIGGLATLALGLRARDAGARKFEDEETAQAATRAQGKA